MLCVDVGPSMSIPPPAGGDTHLEMAIKIANQIVQQKVGRHACLHADLVPSNKALLLLSHLLDVRWEQGLRRSRAIRDPR